jgi:DNA-binding response OmpR family regulator
MSVMTTNILVVDDDEPIQQVLSHNLENDIYATRICNDGKEAAELLEDGYEPELAIFDVMMPRLDGTRLLRMVRNGEFPVSEDLPIIMLTSRGREEHVLEGFESGADDYMTKPFKPPELLARVERFLND